jgi:hypothetical protein
LIIVADKVISLTESGEGDSALHIHLAILDGNLPSPTFTLSSGNVHTGLFTLLQVVGLDGVATVMKFDTEMRNPLSEVGLECVYADIHQTLQELAVPLAGFGIGKVHNCHTGLPKIPLPNIAVGALDKVSIVDSFLEDRSSLTDIRVYPHADLDVVLFFYRFDIRLRVGECFVVEFE